MAQDIPRTEIRTVCAVRMLGGAYGVEAMKERLAEGPVWLRHGAQTHSDSTLLGSGSWEQVLWNRG
jgi:hypothetical protein